MGLKIVGGGHASGKVAARSGGGRRKRLGGMPEVALADWAGAILRDSPGVVRWERRAPTGPSGWQGNGAQSGEGVSELIFPGPALGQMPREAARGAGEASGDGAEASPEGLGGYQLLAQTDARGPAGQVMRHHLDGQPGGVGGEAARGEMVETHAVLEVADGVLDLGVARLV